MLSKQPNKAKFERMDYEDQRSLQRKRPNLGINFMGDSDSDDMDNEDKNFSVNKQSIKLLLI